MAYFYKVPVNYKENDYKKIMVRFCIDSHKDILNRVTVSVNYICRECGYSTSNRNSSSFSGYVKDCIRRFISDGELVQYYGKEIDSGGYNDLMGFYVQEKFYDSQPKTFCKLTDTAFYTIVNHSDEVSVSTPMLLKIYTCLRGHIVENNRTAYGYCQSVETMCNELEVSNRKMCDTALDFFVKHGLFKRYVTGSCYVNGKPKNVPNIYVLPDDRATDNINGLLQVLKERYQVDEFAPVLLPNIKRKIIKED